MSKSLRLSPPLFFIVEDSPIIRELVEFTLRKMMFCNVIKYSTALDALKALTIITPDLIVLDYALDNDKKNAPNGLLFLEKMKKLKLKIPTIVFSGQNKKNVAINMIRNGAIDYVSKDSEMFIDELMGAINGALEYRSNSCEIDARRISKLRKLRQTRSELF